MDYDVFPISKKPYLHFLLILLFCCATSIGYAQTLNDYRSVASGNWTTVSIWEVWDGSAWVAATTYPGEVAGTNDVSIEGGYTVTLSSTIPNSFNSLTIGDGTGGTDTLAIGGNSYLDISLMTYADGGFGTWLGNYALGLPAGAAVIIETGGSLDDSPPCNANKKIQIGGINYSTCNGGNGTYTFDDIVVAGGTISVSPSSNGPICEGATLNLFANPSGTASSGGTFNWSGTGPGAYTYSSTDQDPTITGLIAGSYTYTVTITGTDGLTHTNAVSVTVNAGPTISTQPGSIVSFAGNSTSFTVVVSGADTYQWQLSIDGGSTFANVSDGGIYSGATTATLSLSVLDIDLTGYQYRVLVSDSSTGCSPTASSAATLTVRVKTVITNRKITYRVKKS